jgi:N-acetyl-gamma-glutamyl-phosphate reductase
MPSVFIDGQAGTTGLEITGRLADRTDIDLLEIDPARRKDPSSRQALMAEADVTVLCLPDDAAREAVALAPAGARILDASTAHRTDPDWVYGCPELSPEQRSQISAARRVSNPGCYPQGFILLVRPLVDAGILSADAALSVFGLSGYSGGGSRMIETYRELSPDKAEAWNSRPYGLDQQHKHLPEMRLYGGLTEPPVFSPVVANYYQGMLIEVPLHRRALAGRPDGAGLTDILATRYAAEPFVEVLPWQADCALDSGYLSPTALNGTNRMQLMVFGNEERYLLIARYDNLGKGASGAAAQNLNLMLGMEECLGL